MVALEKLASAIGSALDDEVVAQKIELTSIVSDSHAVTPGALFVAIPGMQVHGAQFAGDALDRGAVAIVTDPQGAETIGAVTQPVLIVKNVAERLGEIAAHFYGEPASQLRCFGVTGTNGKTTTSYMLEQVLTAAGNLTALIGGVELRIGGVHTSTSITTPLPIDIQRMLATHLEAGGSDAVMEVTSHALLQHRTDPIRFAVAGFTQLSIDHLDYHPSVEEYFAAKSELFVADRCEIAVITVDDEWGRKLYEIAQTRLQHVHALSVAGNLPQGSAGWWVDDIDIAGNFTLHGPDGFVEQFRCTLPGAYNISNAALAIVMAVLGGVSVDVLPRVIDAHVPGRMEVIAERSPRVIVDFAHNADALAKALIALRPTTEGRLIVVTGTAGDRDATKRFAMGEATALHADVVVITDDDPHTEDPQQIRDALIEGTVGHNVEVIEIADRTEAIYEAVAMAGEADTVMIAGRGHWTVQFVGHDLIDIDDREVAREALGLRAARREER